MIAIELFQHKPHNGIHAFKIWINGELAYANDVCSVSMLKDLRNALRDELLWLDDYLREEGA